MTENERKNWFERGRNIESKDDFKQAAQDLLAESKQETDKLRQQLTKKTKGAHGELERMRRYLKGEYDPTNTEEYLQFINRGL